MIKEKCNSYFEQYDGFTSGSTVIIDGYEWANGEGYDIIITDEDNQKSFLRLNYELVDNLQHFLSSLKATVKGG